MQSSAILSDPPWWVCLGASAVCGFLVGHIAGCAVGALVTAGVAFAVCFSSVLAAVGAGWAILTSCTTLCCCMGYAVCCA